MGHDRLGELQHHHRGEQHTASTAVARIDRDRLEQLLPDLDHHDPSGFSPGGYTYSCDFASGGDASYPLTVTSNPETIDNGHTCYDTDPGDTVWVTIGSVSSNTITVASSTPPPLPSPESIEIAWSSSYPTWITMTLSGFLPGGYTYSCDFASGGDASYPLTVTSNPETIDSGHTCYDTDPGGLFGSRSARGERNTITVASSTPPPPPPAQTYPEATGDGPVHTWGDPNGSVR